MPRAGTTPSRTEILPIFVSMSKMDRMHTGVGEAVLKIKKGGWQKGGTRKPSTLYVN
jgi:hypothetical protein